MDALTFVAKASVSRLLRSVSGCTSGRAFARHPCRDRQSVHRAQGRAARTLSQLSAPAAFVRSPADHARILSATPRWRMKAPRGLRAASLSRVVVAITMTWSPPGVRLARPSNRTMHYSFPEMCGPPPDLSGHRLAKPIRSGSGFSRRVKSIWAVAESWSAPETTSRQGNCPR